MSDTLQFVVRSGWCAIVGREQEGDRGPRAGSPREVVVAAG